MSPKWTVIPERYSSCLGLVIKVFLSLKGTLQLPFRISSKRIMMPKLFLFRISPKWIVISKRYSSYLGLVIKVFISLKCTLQLPFRISTKCTTIPKRIVLIWD